MNDQSKIWDAEYRNHPSKWKLERRKFPASFKGKKILEVGVGNGKNIPSILEQKPKQLTAIDISMEAVKTVKLRHTDKNLEIKTGDIISSGFEDESFDIVLCYYILNNLLVDQRIVAAREIHRILKKGGVLLIEDFAEGDLRSRLRPGELIEDNTFVKKNGLLCHFFNEGELKELFGLFSSMKIQKKSFRVVKKDPKSTRKILSAALVK